MLVISSQMLSFKASMVHGLSLYTLSFKKPQSTKDGEVKCGNQGSYRFYEMILSHSGAMTHAVKMNATHQHMFRTWKVTHAQCQHEQAMLLKQA